MTLGDLNQAEEVKALEALFSCCGSERWTDQMLLSRPFSSHQTLHSTAELLWSSLAPADWLEAFSKHPQIGSKTESRWSQAEQSGMLHAADSLTRDVARLNAQYRQRFGFIFIICATGKTAAEMFDVLQQRLANDRSAELTVAAAEQAKIMHLRLDKLLTE